MRRLVSIAAVASFGLLVSCDWPGKPDPSHKWKAESQITDFDELYSTSCRGCHAIGEGLAAGRPLNDPIYLAFIPQDVMKSVTEKGVPGTAMPSFAEAHGGALTESQIDVVVNTLYQRYSRPQDLGGVKVPPYSAPMGSVGAGEQVFQTYCASCHGADGTGGPKGRSVVDPTYLSLVSDQALRSAVVAGRVDLGMPDWRGNVPGKPMSDAEIADVVAWLASKRPVSGSPTFEPSAAAVPGNTAAPASAPATTPANP